MSPGGRCCPSACISASTSIEGEFATPDAAVPKRFTINPVAVILALIFWYWMWGVTGAILAVPLLAIVKIICDDLRPATGIRSPVGELVPYSGSGDARHLVSVSVACLPHSFGASCAKRMAAGP